MLKEMADPEEPEKTIADEAVVGKYAAAAEITNRKDLSSIDYYPIFLGRNVSHYVSGCFP